MPDMVGALGLMALFFGLIALLEVAVRAFMFTRRLFSALLATA